MKAPTLERRVMLWSAAVVALSLLICGGSSALFLYRETVKDLDREAREVAEHFFELAREHGGTAFNWDDLHEVQEWLPDTHQREVVELFRNGKMVFRSANLGDTSLPVTGAAQFVELPQGRMRLDTVTDLGATMRVAVPTDRVSELGRTFLIIFVTCLPVMLYLVFFGGRWIARQALDPVRRIADEAEGITPQNLDRRVHVPVPDDEIRRLALVLNSTMERLEWSFRQAMRFSADASHELKTPLTVLHADLEALLHSSTMGDTDRAAVADALESAKRLNAITRSLLLLARADAGHLQIEQQPVDFAQIITECLEDTGILAEIASLQLDVKIPASAMVLGDAVRLRQIVGNLLDNAVKYNNPGGKIRVTLESCNRTWILDASNTGPGISEEQASMIFERFHRGQHQAKIVGHGLGLSLSRELARAHGATLELACSADGWTTFRFVVNAADSPAAVTPP
jgi:signal transduction histidine kinase